MVHGALRAELQPGQCEGRAAGEDGYQPAQSRLGSLAGARQRRRQSGEPGPEGPAQPQATGKTEACSDQGSVSISDSVGSDQAGSCTKQAEGEERTAQEGRTEAKGKE